MGKHDNGSLHSGIGLGSGVGPGSGLSSDPGRDPAFATGIGIGIGTGLGIDSGSGVSPVADSITAHNIDATVISPKLKSPSKKIQQSTTFIQSLNSFQNLDLGGLPLLVSFTKI